MKVIFNITENKNKATFQQEVVKINTSFNQTENIVKPKFQIGYYPLPVSLENYYTKNETYNQNELNGFLNLKADLSLLNNYYTETEINNKLQLKQNLPTGYVTGLQLSIHPTDNTKAIIGIGAYIITDFSDLENITATLVQVTEPIEFTPAYLTTSPSSYIALDINKNVIQSAIPFDNADRRTFCLVGNVVHSNLTNINVVNEIKAPIIAPTNQLHDLIKAVGFLNLEGNLISPNGSNLSLNKSAGKIWGLGINGGDYLDPHVLTLPEQTTITFRYRLSVSPLVEYADRVTLDPTQFEPNGGGALSPLSNNNRWSVQHLNIFQSGVVRVQYGQHEYDSFVKARNAAFTEQFVTEQNIADNAIFRCYIIMKKTCTNLQLDITNGEAEIIHIGKFGNAVGGSNASLTLSNILAVLGYTPENVANKSDSYTASSSTTYVSTKALVDGLATKADLVDGKVPSSQLPSYVDDVLEFANLSNFPATGESGKIYIAIDTNITYRWTGTGYAEISASLALGETSSTAYRGDRGKIAFDHSQTIGNPHGTTKSDIGLGNVNNTSDLDKPISTATQNALNTKADLAVVNNLQIGGRNLIIKSRIDTLIYDNEAKFIFWSAFSEPLKVGSTYVFRGFNKTKDFPELILSDGVNDYNNGQNIFEGVPFVAQFPSKSIRSYHRAGEGDYYVEYIKLEKGNKATDWTPAPEDKQDRLQDITGNIGVGKTDASATEKLDVNGNIKATSFIFLSDSIKTLPASVGVFKTQTGGSKDFELIFNRSASGTGAYYSIQSVEQNIAYRDIILQPSGGNVGIGTTSPTEKLHSAYNIASGASGYGDGSFLLKRASDGLSVANFSINTTSSLAKLSTAFSYLTFETEGVERARFVQGNLGIGTTSPSYPLHVATQVSNTSIYAAYDIVAFSDISVKNNIRPIDNVLERVINSRGVLYDRIDSGEKNNIGFIAQELEEQFPELIVENPDGTKAVKYQNAVAILFEAIKEQQKQINELRNGITD